MANTKFEVDLGNLALSEAQKASINSAIQQAVTGELAKFNFKNRVVLIPVNKWPKGPIINGIIARDLSIDSINSILDSKIR